MKIFLGTDHNGFALKQKLSDYLHTRGYEIFEDPAQTLNPEDDFPEFASKTVKALQATQDPEDRAILICGSGQGMCMAANRYKGIRASLVWNQSEARAARNDDDSNVLCLAAREITDFDQIVAITEVWLKTPFLGAERFLRRIKQLDELN
ncbi:MAG: RpiB/LacA/LacB family sugar-phosphate isomerase [Candidatus Saccharimonadales bacterium]